MTYLFCENLNADKPEEDFKEFIDLFFETKANEIPEEALSVDCVKIEEKTGDKEQFKSEKPRILFECYFSHYDSKARLDECLDPDANLPANLFITTGANPKIDFDDHVAQAREIFKKICPDQEFLPKPPDQEDIIFDHDEEAGEKKESDKEAVEEKQKPEDKQESPEITQAEKRSRVLPDTESEDKPSDIN